MERKWKEKTSEKGGEKEDVEKKKDSLQRCPEKILVDRRTDLWTKDNHRNLLKGWGGGCEKPNK